MPNMAKTPNIKSGPLYRSFEIDRAAMKEDARTVELSFASEEPYERWFGIEILDCQQSSVDLSRINNGGALLVDHDTSDQVGVVEKSWVDKDRKCRALVRFGTSARASEIYEDVKNKIRRLVSVGYRVRKMVTEKVENDVETMRVTDWLPLELSIVAVPADASVGIGRNGNTEENEIVIYNSKRNMFKIKPLVMEGAETTPASAPPPAPAPAKPVAVVIDHSDAIRQERERVREINATAERIGTDSAKRAAKQHIEEGKPLDVFNDFILRNEFKAKPVDIKPEIGMTEKEVRQYSILKAIRGLADPQVRRLEGLEKECHETIAKQLKRASGAMEFFVPYEVEQHRALTAGSYSGGGATIATELKSDSMIELVRNQMFVMAMGARNLTGLVGDIAIPRQSGGATAYWLAETATLTRTTQAVGQLTLVPHRLAAATAYTNQFLAQTSLDAESFVRNDLATVIALEKDETALNGTGAAGEPLGICATTGVNVCTMGATTTLSYAECVSFETVLVSSNTLKGGLGWLVTPTRRHHLRTTFINSTGGETPLWAQNGLEGNIIGYPAKCTNQVSATYPMIFGEWAQLIIGDWSGLSILVDPYSLSLSNQVSIVVQTMTDIGVREPAAFAIANQ